MLRSETLCTESRIPEVPNNTKKLEESNDEKWALFIWAIWIIISHVASIFRSSTVVTALKNIL